MEFRVSTKGRTVRCIRFFFAAHVSTMSEHVSVMLAACFYMQDQRRLLLWDLGSATSRAEGKPPPESYDKIVRVGAMNHLVPIENRKRTMLLTDGARCYPRLAGDSGVLHACVAHSNGQFVAQAWRGQEKISVHTGTIDAIWNSLKSWIPNSLTSQSPDLMMYVKAWQWRFVNKYKDVEKKTLQYLNKWSTGQSAAGKTDTLKQSDEKCSKPQRNAKTSQK